MSKNQGIPLNEGKNPATITKKNGSQTTPIKNKP